MVNAVGWRGMFFIEGAPAKWFPAADARRLRVALAEEQRGIAQVGSYNEAFRTAAVILLVVQYFCWSIGVYGLVLWPPMLKSAGPIGIVEIGWLSSAPYLLAALLLVAALLLCSVLMLIAHRPSVGKQPVAA